ncbi:hypothetical protein [Allostreptomyces psammosilenae]|uniref:Uncharacterized protein n=1 Tax=Allostreptomyces psammosilenae TaxID=1892865 RepID=A0A852ZX12_9ACTN|nr:hypothetical protein [Allostreptomyces psammosilenae]NYI06545.1 hypothetical protein [Allostreptomyces psammosilenae]
MMYHDHDYYLVRSRELRLEAERERRAAEAARSGGSAGGEGGDDPSQRAVRGRSPVVARVRRALRTRAAGTAAH